MKDRYILRGLATARGWLGALAVMAALGLAALGAEALAEALDVLLRAAMGL